MIPVNITRVQSWSVYIGAGISRNLTELIDFATYSSGVLMADENTHRLYGRPVKDMLEAAGKPVLAHVVPAGESSKSSEEAERAYRFLQSHNIDRKALIIVLGGGVVGDLAGYVAATYLRGIDYVQVPTTLLAQVDSSLGGKVGINFGGKKNIIGSFYQPKAVVSDIAFLDSLPDEERRNGLAEVIKYGVAMDARLFSLLSDRPDCRLKPEEMVDIVERCSALKLNVVRVDETERTGERAILNFGHTVAHAIEAGSGLSGSHGAAVAVGMAAAGRISERMGMINKKVTDQIEGTVLKFALPVRCPSMKPEALLAAMRFDKKVDKGQLKWVLLEGIGKGITNRTVPDNVVREVLEEICR